MFFYNVFVCSAVEKVNLSMSTKFAINTHFNWAGKDVREWFLKRISKLIPWLALKLKKQILINLI